MSKKSSLTRSGHFPDIKYKKLDHYGTPRDAVGIEKLQAKYDLHVLRIKPRCDIETDHTNANTSRKHESIKKSQSVATLKSLTASQKHQK